VTDPRRHRPLAFAAAAAVFVIDQLVKWIVTGPLRLPARDAVEILPVFDLRFVPNYGISMGLLLAEGNTQRWLLVALTAAIAVAVTVWLWRERNRPDAVALGCVLGGAIGNILDRVRYGYVVDYADLHFGAWRPFLVFNVADAAITIGVLLLLVRALFTREKRPREMEDA
jgi:signal peptidase II